MRTGLSGFSSRLAGILGFPPAPALYASIDSTGLFLKIRFPKPTSSGSGSPTLTANGDSVTLGSPVLTSGGTVWTYPITGGNPDGDPILAFATVILNTVAGVWLTVPVINDHGVINNSTVVPDGTLLWPDGRVDVWPDGLILLWPS